MSSGQCDLPTLCVSEKKVANNNTPADNGKLKWNQVFPEKVKTVIWTIKESSSKLYESTPPKTMKYLALVSFLILFFAVISLVIAQKDEATQSNYGMAFPIEEASNQAEKRTAFLNGVPGEISTSTETTEAPATTEASETETTVETETTKAETTSEEEGKKPEDERNPRIIFIERLMGLHVSAPVRENGTPEEKEEPNNILNNPMDKVNAKWASRMRKFSIPLPSTDDQPPIEQQNPMFRYAAANMISRLIAAAARSQMEAQAREAGHGKDKDENEDETVPVIVATMRDERNMMERERVTPMYGRPMARPRPIPPFTPFNQQRMIQSLHQMPSIQSIPSAPQRAYAAPPRLPVAIQRRSNPVVQPVLVMVAVPIDRSQAIGHQQQQQQQQNHQHLVYPSTPYTPFARQSSQYAYAVPVHIPIPHRPQYPRQMTAYSQIRPVIEVPVEVPVPYHVPVMPRRDHETASSDQDHIVLLYDAEIHHGDEDLEQSASENPHGKSHHFISRPMPQIFSPNKMKLWRDLVNAKHAIQPGVRFIPVSMSSSEEHRPQVNHYVQPAQREQPAESSHQPAFLVLAEQEEH